MLGDTLKSALFPTTPSTPLDKAAFAWKIHVTFPWFPEDSELRDVSGKALAPGEYTSLVEEISPMGIIH